MHEKTVRNHLPATNNCRCYIYCQLRQKWVSIERDEEERFVPRFEESQEKRNQFRIVVESGEQNLEISIFAIIDSNEYALRECGPFGIFDKSTLAPDKVEPLLTGRGIAFRTKSNAVWFGGTDTEYRIDPVDVESNECLSNSSAAKDLVCWLGVEVNEKSYKSEKIKYLFLNVSILLTFFV